MSAITYDSPLVDDFGETFAISDVHAIAPRQAVWSLYLNCEAIPARAGGVAATVENSSWRFDVSQLDGETDWIVDAKWRTNCAMPVFMHGEGARYTILTAIQDTSVIRALDYAAEGCKVAS